MLNPPACSAVRLAASRWPHTTTICAAPCRCAVRPDGPEQGDSYRGPALWVLDGEVVDDARRPARVVNRRRRDNGADGESDECLVGGRDEGDDPVVVDEGGEVGSLPGGGVG